MRRKVDGDDQVLPAFTSAHERTVPGKENGLDALIHNETFRSAVPQPSCEVGGSEQDTGFVLRGSGYRSPLASTAPSPPHLRVVDELSMVERSCRSRKEMSCCRSSSHSVRRTERRLSPIVSRLVPTRSG